MKKTLLALSTTCCLLLGPSAFADLKVGVVNTHEIFLKAPQMVAKREALKKQLDTKEKEFIEAQKDFQKAYETYSKNSATMKPEAQKVEQQKLAEKQKKLQEMQIKFQNDVNVGNEDINKDFTKRLTETVEKIASDKKLDLVLVKAGLAYNKKELEITDEVLGKMKK